MSDQPQTLDELLTHYRRMAGVHHEAYLDGTKQMRRRLDNSAMATAYHSAANELERVLRLVTPQGEGGETR